MVIPVKALEFDVSSGKAILYNTLEDKVLYEKDSNTRGSIASLTKITTGIVALEHIKNLDDKIILKEEDFAGLKEANAAVAGFQVGEEVTYRDLLYGLMLPSGADAAQALCRNIAKSNSGFIELMNNKAKELNLENTHYVNPVGLDDKDHYSTVSDVLTIFKYALQNKDFKEIVSTDSYVTSNKKHTFKSTLAKANSLGMDYLIGGKTGTTDDAGLCLASIANYDNTDFLLVTTNAEYSKTIPRAFIDHKTIYEFVRDNYDYYEVTKKGDIFVKLKTKYLKQDSISIKASKNIKKYLENSFDKKKVKYKYKGERIVTTKMHKGDKIGKVDIYYDNNLLISEDAILREKPEFSISKYLLDHKLVVGVSIILFGSLIVVIRKKRRKIKKKRK